MEEVLIVYYSRTGTTRQAAQQLAAMTGWPLAEVVDESGRAGWVGDLRCMLDVLLRRRPAYGYQGPGFASTEHLVVMAPVWLGRLAAPMRAFLCDRGTLANGVSAVIVMASRGGLSAGEEIGRIVGRAPRPMLTLRQRDVQSGAAAGALEGFVADWNTEQRGQGAPNRQAWLSPREA